MTVEVPSTGRATVTDTPQGMEITIPAKRFPIMAVMQGLFLIWWTFGLVMVSNKLMDPSPPYKSQVGVISWLVLWIIGGLVVLWSLVWQIVGREVITVNERTIGIKYQWWVPRRDREYLLNDAGKFWICPDPHATSQPRVVHFRDFGRMPKGTIRFDYGKKTVTFGLGLDEVEAAHLIKVMRDRGYIRSEQGILS